jgi:hypothetical protein
MTSTEALQSEIDNLDLPTIMIQDAIIMVCDHDNRSSALEVFDFVVANPDGARFDPIHRLVDALLDCALQSPDQLPDIRRALEIDEMPHTHEHDRDDV